MTSALPSLSLSSAACHIIPNPQSLPPWGGGSASPGGVEMVSEQLLEGVGEALGLRFGETAVKTNNTWLAFMKGYDFHHLTNAPLGDFTPGTQTALSKSRAGSITPQLLLWPTQQRGLQVISSMGSYSLAC